MEINYNISRDDFWNFVRFYLERYRHLRLRVALTSLFLAGLFFLIVTYMHWLPLASRVVLACACGLIYPPCAYASCKRKALRVPSRDGSTLGAHYLRIDAEGVFARSKAGEGLIRWTGVTNLGETKDHIFIFVDTANAIIVPKRSFAAETEKAEFLSKANSFWKAARA